VATLSFKKIKKMLEGCRFQTVFADYPRVEWSIVTLAIQWRNIQIGRRLLRLKAIAPS
jgi:hypothetical protein